MTKDDDSYAPTSCRMSRSFLSSSGENRVGACVCLCTRSLACGTVSVTTELLKGKLLCLIVEIFLNFIDISKLLSRKVLSSLPSFLFISSENVKINNFLSVC